MTKLVKNTALTLVATTLLSATVPLAVASADTVSYLEQSNSETTLIKSAQVVSNVQPNNTITVESTNKISKDNEGSSINDLENYAIKTGGTALFGGAVVSGAKHTIKWIKAHL